MTVPDPADAARAAATSPRGRPPMSDELRRTHRLAVARHAVALFVRQGVAATSGDQIAAAAGLSTRTLWRWFRTKESCVEPLLAASTEAFVETVRTWPSGRGLADHLEAHYRLPDPARAADLAAVLDVVRLARTEPGLRAVWLVVGLRVEPVLAGAIAARTGLAPDAFEVRVQAAAVNAALRISSEDAAGPAGAAGAVGETVDGHRSRLATAIRIATRGLPSAGGGSS